MPMFFFYFLRVFFSFSRQLNDRLYLCLHLRWERGGGSIMALFSLVLFNFVWNVFKECVCKRWLIPNLNVDEGGIPGLFCLVWSANTPLLLVIKLFFAYMFTSRIPLPPPAAFSPPSWVTLSRHSLRCFVSVSFRFHVEQPHFSVFFIPVHPSPPLPCAPSRKRCVVNGQTTTARNK